MNDIVLDLTGLKCPLPALRTRKALKALPAGARLTVTCTDPMAGIDIPHLISETGDHLEAQHLIDGKLVFVLVRRMA